MKLVVPYIGELRDLDARTASLAEFLGIPCEMLPLPKVVEHTAFLKKTAPDECSCFVVNPEVIKEWVGLDGITADLVAFVCSHFPYVLVHGLRTDRFDSEIVATLSQGRLQSVREIDPGSTAYEIAENTQDICGAFSGLSFGAANPANDHVFSLSDSGPALRTLISIGGLPFMTAVKLTGTEILFVASEEVADLDAELGDAPLDEYFSRFLPQIMALRRIFGQQCWHPVQHHASVIIDDPLLQPNYGFLNFEHLLELMKVHNFHTTIAFIPHNFRRSSAAMAKLFRDNPERFSLCFHGNDHTGGEFASTDSMLIDTMLQIAEKRMLLHSELSGLPCDRVMVFPQGSFSLEAMDSLNFHHFDAAVNTVTHPRQEDVRLTFREIAQPAVLRYSGFPLFLRKNSLKTQATEIAFKLFFGIPILIVEHHDVFKEPQSLIDAVNRINMAAPGILWSSAGEAVKGSVLGRRVSGGRLQLRAYARTIRIENLSESPERIVVEWAHPGVARSFDAVHRNGVPCTDVELSDSQVRVSAVLEPGISEVFSIRPPRPNAALVRMSFGYSTRAFVRRRLSEIRDNYISKSPALLAATKTLRRSLHH